MKVYGEPAGLLGANFYITADEESNEAILIDPGADGEKIVNALKNLGCKLKYIIITHAHADHIGALDFVAEQTGAPVVIHTLDSDALNNSVWNLCDRFHMASPKKKCDIAVSDNDTLMLGNNIIEFIHTPGHTRGSMCIHIGDMLFSGDTLFRASIGRTDFMGGSYADITDSINNKLFALSGNTKVYPGHGEETTIQYEKENNPFV